MRARVLLLLYVLLMLLPGTAWAADIYGTVRLAETDQLIPNVLISLQGPNQTMSGRTDLTGVFEFEDLQPGNYEVAIAGHGTIPDLTQEVMLEADSVEKVEFVIEGAVEEWVDIRVDVQCVVSNVFLEGAVITADFFGSGDGSGTPTGSFNVTTNKDGEAVFAGVPPGTYRFSVTHPDWEDYVLEDPVTITEEHTVSFSLEPIFETLTVSAFAPSHLGDATGPSSLDDIPGAAITLIGLDFKDDPADPDVDMLPPKTRIRYELWEIPENTFFIPSGVIFGKLPRIPYRVEVRHPAYEPFDGYISVEELKTGEVEFEMDRIESSLTVRIDDSNSPQPISAMLLSGSTGNNRVILEGLTGTTTERLSRTGNFSDVNGETEVTFDRLLPGKYRLKTYAYYIQQCERSPHVGLTQSLRHVIPTGESIIEIGLGTDQVHEVPWEPEPAKISGRVIEHSHGFSDGYEYPVHAPGTTVEFVAHSEDVTTTASTEIYSATLDAMGNFALEVPPSCYGIRMPSLTQYNGHKVRTTAYKRVDSIPDVRTEDPPGTTGEFNWPHPLPWPHTGYDFARDGVPLGITSEARYDIELVLDRNETRYEHLVRWEDYDSLMLPTGDTGIAAWQVVEPTIQVSGSSPDIKRLDAAANETKWLISLPPGTHTISTAHPAYDVPDVIVDVPAWGAPGVPPGVDPDSTGYFSPQSLERPSAVLGEGGDNVVILEHVWNGSQYNNPSFVPGPYITEIPGMSGLFFRDATSRPGGATTYHAAGGGWWSAQTVSGGAYDVYVGGPSDNTNSAPPDLGPIEYTVTTVAEDGTPIDGLEVRLGDSSIVTTPYTVSSTTSVFILNVETPGWTLVREEEAGTSVSPIAVELRAVVYRTVDVTGTVTSDGVALEGAAVSVWSSEGDRLGPPARTDSSGAYSITAGAQPFFVMVDDAGHEPVRDYVDVLPTDTQVTADVDLTRTAPPIVNSFEIDRNGLFLSGVLLSGDPLGMDVRNAASDLTATWTADLSGVALSRAVTRFPNEPGPDTLNFTDEIAEVWLMGGNVYPQDVESKPEDVLPVTFPDPFTGRQFNEMRTTYGPNAGEQIVFSRGEPQPDGTWQGQLKLWEVPPGPLNAKVVVISQTGAVRVVDYVPPAGKLPLFGAKLKRWASVILDTIGLLTWKPDVDASEGLFPDSSIVPSGSYDATIGKVPGSGELIYDFSLGAKLKSGNENAKGGIISALPKQLGVSVGAGVQMVADGSKNQVKLSGKASATVSVSTEEFAPAVLKRVGLLPHLEGTFTQKASISEIQKVNLLGGDSCMTDADCPNAYCLDVGGLEPTCSEGTDDYKVKLGVGGLGTILAKFPAKLIIRYLGPPGALIAAIMKFTGAEIGVYSKTAMGVDVAMSFITAPEEVGETLQSRLRSNFLGQQEVTETADPLPDPNEPTYELKFTIGLGWGLYFKSVGGIVSGAAGFKIGEANNMTGNGVEVTFNTSSTPLLRRIKGAASMEASVKVKFVGLSLSKNWQTVGFPFDQQFASDPVGSVVSTASDDETIRPQDAAPAVFGPSGSTLLTGLFGGGAKTVSTSGDLLVFTQTTPQGVDLVGSQLVTNGWTEPALIESMGGVTGLALGKTSNGEWLLAYPEIAVDDLGDPLAVTPLRFVTTVNGADWSAPRDLFSHDGAVIAPQIAQADESLLVGWIAPRGHFLSKKRSLHVSWFDGSEMSDTQEITDGRLSDFALAGTTDGGAVVWTDDQGVYVREWDGAAWGTDAVVQDGGNAMDVAAVYVGSDLVIAVPQGSGGVALYTQNGSEWESVTTLDGSMPRSIEAQATSDGVVIAWLEGTEVDNIFVASVALDGTVNGDVASQSTAEGGYFSELGLAPVPGSDEFQVSVVDDSSTLSSFVFSSAGLVDGAEITGVREPGEVDPNADPENNGGGENNGNGGDGEGGSSGGGCGCTTAPGSDGSVVLLLFGLIAIRRRKVRNAA